MERPQARFCGRKSQQHKEPPLPALPGYHALAVIALTIVVLYLFARDRYPPQTTGFAALLALALGFYLFPYPGVEPKVFFSRFGDDALVTVCAFLVMVKGLDVTGALRPLTSALARVWEKGGRRALLISLIMAAGSSLFINDTPLMAVLFPVLLACANRSNTPPSQVLLPLNYAVLIGGMATTIGTSTNLLAVGVAQDLGVGPFYLFDLTPPVLFAGSLGLLFVWVAAPRLLPKRGLPVSSPSPRIFSAVLHVNQGSLAHGMTVAEAQARTQGRMRIERIQRAEDFTVATVASMKLQTGDRLYVKDTRDRLKEFEQALGATLYNAGDLEHPVSDRVPLDSEGQQLAEVVITRASLLYQRVLEAADFVIRYNLVPLAIHRAGATGTDGRDLEKARLRAGDVILVQGSREAIRELRLSGSMLVLDGTTDLPHTDRALLAVLIMAVVVVFHATGLMPISIGALIGMAAMLVTRCLHWRHIGQALNVSLVMVIVASLSLATALVHTGAGQFVADLLVWATQGLPASVVLAGVMLAITVLANLVTNNAAAVIGVPIAISIAQALGVSEEAFVLAVIYGANMPFSTPAGYQTNAMVRNAGGYSSEDYLRLGVPLTAIMLPAFTIFLAAVYDL
jgi:di/tricarboxylate transporter